MNREFQEQLECWADGELEASAARVLADRLRRDPAACEVAEGLRAFRRQLRDHEPARAVPAAPEFYWSQIRRGIEAHERARLATAAGTAHSSWARRWLRGLVPAAGLAAVVYFFMRPGSFGPLPAGSLSAASQGMVGHVVEQQIPAMTTLTFYSAQDATTVVWVGRVDML